MGYSAEVKTTGGWEKKALTNTAAGRLPRPIPEGEQ